MLPTKLIGNFPGEVMRVMSKIFTILFVCCLVAPISAFGQEPRRFEERWVVPECSQTDPSLPACYTCESCQIGTIRSYQIDCSRSTVRIAICRVAPCKSKKNIRTMGTAWVYEQIENSDLPNIPEIDRECGRVHEVISIPLS